MHGTGWCSLILPAHYFIGPELYGTVPYCYSRGSGSVGGLVELHS